MKVVMSSGHGKYISGAVGPSPWGLHEHTEAVRVVDQAAVELRKMGVDVVTYEDTVSKTQNENLDRIINFHNSQGAHNWDISVHFNDADPQPSGPVGCEVLYTSNTGKAKAKEVVDTICSAVPFINRGPKYRDRLAFLNRTNEPAILIEVCFVNSKPDCDLYRTRFNDVCAAIASGIAGEDVQPGPAPEPEPEPPAPPSTDHPTLKKGDTGSWVSYMQSITPLIADGDFGSNTDSALRYFQKTHGLTSDGICGPSTWNALETQEEPEPPKPPPGELPAEQQRAIKDIAASSAIADYNWGDRGKAPAGYTQGMALAFANSYLRLKDSDDAGVEMAKANTGNDSKDALSWYNSDFKAKGMSNETAGPDTLRHLYVLLLGLGMRESSGKHCEGRDMSATNTSSDTAEAGLFQTSYDAHTCNSEFDRLFNDAVAGQSPCYLDTFKQGVSCSSSSWSCYGSGNGYKFQELCKSCPTFAAETCAIVLRNLRQHYGPINRKEAEIRTEADQMFSQVQEYLDAMEAVA